MSDLASSKIVLSPKTKALISCMVSVQLICAFVCSHDTAHMCSTASYVKSPMQRI